MREEEYEVSEKEMAVRSDVLKKEEQLKKKEEELGRRAREVEKMCKEVKKEKAGYKARIDAKEEQLKKKEEEVGKREREVERMCKELKRDRIVVNQVMARSDTVRVFKIDAELRKVFPKCVCGASPPQSGRLLPRFGKFFPEKRKASSVAAEGFFRTRGMDSSASAEADSAPNSAIPRV